jgi:hypothetical protein
MSACGSKGQQQDVRLGVATEVWIGLRRKLISAYR